MAVTHPSVLSKLRSAGRCLASGFDAQLSKNSLDKLPSVTTSCFSFELSKKQFGKIAMKLEIKAVEEKWSLNIQ